MLRLQISSITVRDLALHPLLHCSTLGRGLQRHGAVCIWTLLGHYVPCSCGRPLQVDGRGFDEIHYFQVNN